MTTGFDTELKDSGERRGTPTGAVRDRSTGKGRFDLLPVDALFEIAKHFEKGALKYEDRNWEKGMPLSWFLDSAIRHTLQALRGDVDEPHAVAGAWNLLAFIQTLKWIEQGVLPPTLNDLPKRQFDTRTVDSEFYTPSVGRVGPSVVSAINTDPTHVAVGLDSPADCLQDGIYVQCNNSRNFCRVKDNKIVSVYTDGNTNPLHTGDQVNTTVEELAECLRLGLCRREGPGSDTDLRDGRWEDPTNPGQNWAIVRNGGLVALSDSSGVQTYAKPETGANDYILQGVSLGKVVYAGPEETTGPVEQGIPVTEGNPFSDQPDCNCSGCRTAREPFIIHRFELHPNESEGQVLKYVEFELKSNGLLSGFWVRKPNDNPNYPERECLDYGYSLGDYMGQTQWRRIK